MIDQAISDPRGLESIGDITLLKKVFCSVVERLPAKQILVRLRYSAHPLELLLYLHEVAYLRPGVFDQLAGCLVEELSGYEEGEAELLVDGYRSVRVLDRLKRGDHRRAWDELRDAFKGITDEPRDPTDPKHGTAYQVAATLDTICKLVEQIHAHMVGKGLVEPLVKRYIESPDPHWYSGIISKVPGYAFGCAIDRPVAGMIGPHCIMVLAIVAALNKERNGKRQKRTAEKVARSAKE
jgi:hypothetical protein